MTEHGRHEAGVGTSKVEPPEESAGGMPRPSFGQELRDAVAPRTVALVVGVLVIQLGFILSYVGAFHSPKPHHISVAVVAPSQQAGQIVTALNGIAGSPVHASATSDETSARRELLDGKRSAVLVVNPAGSKDTLLVASGGGTSVATAVEQVLAAADAQRKRVVAVEDILPLQTGDGRGLSGFYLVIGWIVGGYLVAALLGVAKGARPANVRRAVIRLLAVVPYAVLSGLGGTLVVDQVLGALTGHFLALWWLGALVVFGAAAVTMAFQVLFGVLGIGVTVILFVVLGNPSAGGAYQPALLPPFWRAISAALPNGAATDAVRRIVYFNANGIGNHLFVLTVYAVVGSAVALAASRYGTSRER